MSGFSSKLSSCDLDSALVESDEIPLVSTVSVTTVAKLKNGSRRSKIYLCSHVYTSYLHCTVVEWTDQPTNQLFHSPSPSKHIRPPSALGAVHSCKGVVSLLTVSDDPPLTAAVVCWVECPWVSAGGLPWGQSLTLCLWLPQLWHCCPWYSDLGVLVGLLAAPSVGDFTLVIGVGSFGVDLVKGCLLGWCIYISCLSRSSNIQALYSASANVAGKFSPATSREVLEQRSLFNNGLGPSCQLSCHSLCASNSCTYSFTVSEVHCFHWADKIASLCTGRTLCFKVPTTYQTLLRFIWQNLFVLLCQSGAIPAATASLYQSIIACCISLHTRHSNVSSFAFHR